MNGQISTEQGRNYLQQVFQRRGRPQQSGNPRAAATLEASLAIADGDVEPAEQADPVEDPNDQPTPKGAAYEVEISKDGQALKVFLDSSLKPIETQRDAG